MGIGCPMPIMHNRSGGSSNITCTNVSNIMTLCEDGGFRKITCESFKTHTHKSALSALETAKTASIADLSINKAFPPSGPVSTMPVNVIVMVLLLLAVVSLKCSGSSTPRCRATPANIKATTKLHDSCGFMFPATPIRCFQWPMHLALRQISNYSDREIEKFARVLARRPHTAASKKQLSWSPCVEVLEVRRLEETACLEWDDESDSLWFSPETALGWKGAPELQFQKSRQRLRRKDNMQRQMQRSNV